MAARKERIAAQAELNATLTAERITNQLKSSKQIPLNILVPVFGVSVDKLLQLRGDASLTIQHTHTHQHELVTRFNDLFLTSIYEGKPLGQTVSVES